MSEKSVARRQELVQRLERGFQEAQESERFRAYLDTCAKFHNYSPQNTMLIWLQRPTSTRVAGYNTWLNKFRRQVKKGEKGIQILAPRTYRKRDDDEEDDDRRETTTTFVPVHVFDVSQTDGEPLPSPVDDLEGMDDAGLFSKLDTLASTEGLSIDRAPGNGSGANGYYKPDAKEIWIRPDVSLVMATKTLAHELSHHFSNGNGDCREERETIAESAAYVVLGHYGIDAGDYSFGYLATWTDIKVFRAKVKEIHGIAKTIINAIETREVVPPPPSATPKVDIDGFAAEVRTEPGPHKSTFFNAGIYFPTISAFEAHAIQLRRALYFPVLARPYDAVSPGLGYWAGCTGSGFPERRAWPKNAKGGFKVSAYGMKRTRHDGVRCYGEHRGEGCVPFDFSRCPSIPQAVHKPHWVDIVVKLAQSAAHEIARARYYNLDKQAA